MEGVLQYKALFKKPGKTNHENDALILGVKEEEETFFAHLHKARAERGSCSKVVVMAFEVADRTYKFLIC